MELFTMESKNNQYILMKIQEMHEKLYFAKSFLKDDTVQVDLEKELLLLESTLAGGLFPNFKYFLASEKFMTFLDTQLESQKVDFFYKIVQTGLEKAE